MPTQPMAEPHLPMIRPMTLVGPTMQPLNHPPRGPFAIPPLPPFRPQSLSTRGHVRGRRSQSKAPSRPSSQRSAGREASRATTRRHRKRISSKRPAPKQPSSRPPTPHASEKSPPKPQTVTASQTSVVPKVPKTPLAQRDHTPESSPTCRDLGALTRAAGRLTI
ncbi:hypothetical protein F5Y11DRAFT_347445 [Daldinia sp. FL1419]|nr:hypothetical protein F5Y11DRAFT_347445 [Daldinia sp. FL1419]